MTKLYGQGSADRPLEESQVSSILEEGLGGYDLKGEKILVLTPDATRTAPLPLMIRELIRIIGPRAARLDFMVALGTHPPLERKEILELYGIEAKEAEGPLSGIGFLNHRWDLEETLTHLGRLEAGEIEEQTKGLFSQAVEVVINRAVFDYDRIIVLGPVFPHEVAGFSGGEKYLFPGISGGEFLHLFHWIGAVVTCWKTIGFKETPVRRLISRAAAMLPMERICVSMVVRSKTELAGLYVGPTEESWSAAADLSRKLHVVYTGRSYETVLGVAGDQYTELWVAGKVMYKLEPVVAQGGRLIIYGPHITRVSDVWGEMIERIGYHTRDYFLGRLDRFADVPLGVLAHSTHVKGLGTFVDDREEPRIQVILATSIPEEVCQRINLGYLDPAGIDLEEYRNRQEEGVLFVDQAGEVLHRVEPE